MSGLTAHNASHEHAVHATICYLRIAKYIKTFFAIFSLSSSPFFSFLVEVTFSEAYNFSEVFFLFCAHWVRKSD